MLSIAEYDRRQALARVRASYPALRSFAPVSFAAVNFPTQVTQEAELRRYADIMYETIDREHWLRQVRWSPAEEKAILALRGEVEALTGHLFERPVQPLMCLFPPLAMLRLVEAAAAMRGRRLRVVEIGPGSGFFGAYCLLQGHRYLGIDNTQALYLWQHRLFRWIARDSLEDFALADTPPAAYPESRAALVPWWHFAEMYRSNGLKADIVVCDAAMGEMDPFASRYIIRLSKEMLEQSDVGLFVYQNLGEQRQSDLAAIRQRFQARGYTEIPCGPVQVQAASGHSPVDWLRGLSSGAPPLGSAGGKPPEAMRPAAEFLRIDPGMAMESYAFFDYLQLERG